MELVKWPVLRGNLGIVKLFSEAKKLMELRDKIQGAGFRVVGNHLSVSVLSDLEADNNQTASLLEAPGSASSRGCTPRRRHPRRRSTAASISPPAPGNPLLASSPTPPGEPLLTPRPTTLSRLPD